jgi:(p)ppGpp synthase/HD superfamily hydrolase
MNNWSVDIYNKAWFFATVAHQGQTYGGPFAGMQIDYINHIGSVAIEILWTLNHSSAQYNVNLAIQCALLHDVLEDTKYTYKDIDERFGTEVANGVLALTKNKNIESREEKMLDSLTRIKQQPSEVWMVKLADRITNLYHPPYYWNNAKKRFT